MHSNQLTAQLRFQSSKAIAAFVDSVSIAAAKGVARNYEEEEQAQ